MNKKQFKILNLSLLVLAASFLFAAFVLVISNNTFSFIENETSLHISMPKNSFTLPKKTYDAIGEPFLTLKYEPMKIQLPDLKKVLVFYGKNGRPDAMLTKPHLHFSINGSKNLSAIFPGEKLYLQFNKKASPAQYTFSKENKETPLWIEAEIDDEEALVKVFMQDEKGELIPDTKNQSTFALKPATGTKFGQGTESPEIGGYRIDGSLLSRQKAKWYGQDRFLEKHGGEEFFQVVSKHRIDFGVDDLIYSVFVAPGDCLIWSENRWKVIQPSLESLSNPLLVVKKIEERVMNFELWDVEGKNKIVLNLIKAHEQSLNESFEDSFKFVGARTKSQFVFEIDEERMLLRPKDWLILTDEGWKKLTTPSEIDAYVERKLLGPLFVFDGVLRKDDHQVFLGTVFNTSRTDSEIIELAVNQGGNHENLLENYHQRDENGIKNPVAGSFKNFRLENN